MTDKLSSVSAVAGTLCMCLLFVLLIIRYFKKIFSASDREVCEISREKSGHVWLFVIAVFAVTRIFILLTASVYAHAVSDEYYTSLPGVLSMWVKWDAPHYLGLIENWYVNTGDAAYHIVFFPVYPLICRILLPFFGGSSLLSALFVSNASAVCAGYLMYRIYAGQNGPRSAKLAVILLYTNPLSFFLSIPYTESLFLLVSLLCVYLARKGRFLSACIMGAVCASTRLMGLVIAAPVFFYMLRHDKLSGALTLSQSMKRLAECCIMFLGIAAYLLLNYVVTGSAFTFWVYQKEHWYNTAGTLWNTFSYLVSYAVNTADVSARAGMWISALIGIYGSIILLFIAGRNADPADGAYSWLYLYMTIIPTWLISGARYISGMYCVYPMMTEAIKNKYARGALVAVNLAALAYMTVLFVFRSSVY